MQGMEKKASDDRKNRQKNERAPENKRFDRQGMFMIGVWILVLLPLLLCMILFIRIGQLEKELNEVRELNTAEVSGSFEEKLQQMASAADKEDLAKTDGMPVKNKEQAETKKPSAKGEEQTGAKEDKQQKADSVSSSAIGSQDGEESAQPSSSDGKKHVYLTFDDGPSDYTEPLCEMLEENGMTATFFCIGKTDEHSKEMYQRIVDGGHTLAMHSYSHDYASLYHSLKSFKEDFYKVQNYFEEITGVKPTIYRFPGGSSNQVSSVPIKKCIRFLAREGINYFDWNALNGDAEGKTYSQKEMLKRTMSGIKAYDNPVVLMHDTNAKKSTFEMMPKLIRRLKKMGAVVEGIDSSTPLVQHVKVEDVL